ncbi:MAG: DUF6465 family protein [Oribacterium sp.]|nr:DUF6465 family protein [Oribacterium sp.]
MEKNTKAAAKATEAKKDAALTESFAEIKKAVEKDNAGVKAEEKQASVKKTSAHKASAKKAPVKKETVKKESVKKETVVKAAESKAPVKKEVPAKKEDESVKTTVTFEFNGKQVKAADIIDQAVKAAKAKKADAKDVEVYVVARENAAYYVVDGDNSGDNRIDL